MSNLQFELAIGKLDTIYKAYEEKFNRMHYLMLEESDVIDEIYPICVEEFKDDHIEILGFKQDMSKKTVITSDSCTKLTYKNLLGRYHDPAMEDDDAYTVCFRFLPKA
jgi:hypothetical protein